jgi:hypothetical protein
MLNMIFGMILVGGLSQPAPEKIAIAFDERGDVITFGDPAKCAAVLDRLPRGEVVLVAVVGE